MKPPCLIQFFYLNRNFWNGLRKWKHVALRFTSDLLDMIEFGLGKKIRHRISLVLFFPSISKEHHLQHWAPSGLLEVIGERVGEFSSGVPMSNWELGHTENCFFFTSGKRQNLSMLNKGLKGRKSENSLLKPISL